MPPPVDNSWLLLLGGPYSMRRFTMLSLQSRFALPTVIGLVIALVVPASAQDISDLRRQREQARAAEQEALEQIDLLRADDALVAEVLAEIQGLVDAQTARVAGAQQACARQPSLKHVTV